MELTSDGFRKCEFRNCLLAATQSREQYDETVYLCLIHMQQGSNYDWLFGADYIVKQMTPDEMMPDAE